MISKSICKFVRNLYRKNADFSQKAAILIDDDKVIGLASYDIYYINKTIENFSIIPMVEIKHKIFNEGVKYIILSGYSKLAQLVKLVDEFRVNEIEIENVLIAKRDFYDQDDDGICKWNEYKWLRYLEFHVADHCNLKCAGCAHFSSLVDESVFPKFENVENDFNALKKLVDYIGLIRIMGGEPLLNMELPKYIKMVRRYFPYSKIHIVTNALLLAPQNLNRELINEIIENKVSIDVSVYPPMIGKEALIENYLNKLDIKYNISAPITKFNYSFDLRGGCANGVKSLQCACPNLYDGHIAICPRIAYIKYFNRYSAVKFQENQGLIDIHDESMTYEKLTSKLHEVQDICDYCLFISDSNEKTFEWCKTGSRNENFYFC